MNAYDMLAEIIKFNREMAAKAQSAYMDSVPDSDEFEYTYQIYRDCVKAYEDACRMAKHGVGDLNPPVKDASNTFSWL